ncbi:alfa-L-rhamnosidase [Aquipluma nitroreducens]|uniref:Alfa-L-rhamnosidase n=1 Tax=Aquipluma nitroreducens TaxID=2010828 RepID=A0A5K7S3T3_9BACT|nr:alpha-L-rhamnosidase C-terminal domain-containing protein [Aquipluma nitroreducens]BBE16159.1 alfa-L-rhamnosidase [Aquipluma nitroreducens]
MNKCIVFILLSMLAFEVNAQLPAFFKDDSLLKTRSTKIVRKYLSPQRIVWTSDKSGNQVKNANAILNPGNGQPELIKGEYLKLVSHGDSYPGILLDFGREIHGGLSIITSIGNDKQMGRVRIRFGESVSEAMSDIGQNNATNDHAMRDFVISMPWLGGIEVGNTGFRFVRIDLIDPDKSIEIKEISASFSYLDIPYLGSFISSDERLNSIWMTGAYTVHLNMQDYLWDGIKRDRLVWIGDMHPEVMTINSVFGFNEVVPKSLDLIRDQTPLPDWMNTISSYSIWWILIQHDWFYYQGDLKYLKEQQKYLAALLHQLSTKIDSDGKEMLDGLRFLDWPSSVNQAAIHAGLQSLMVMAFQNGLDLCRFLGDTETTELCQSSLEKLRKHIPNMAGSKQAAALLALSGLVSPEKSNSELLSKNGVHNMSTFYGYYMLKARALDGDYQGALDNIREYWGGMLDLGATTFWEDFNIDWMKNAGRIDELVPEGKADIHGDFGDYCYKGFRHSLCHGWASGPTSWLSQYVLGIEVLEPGCKTIRIKPNLGDLKWVRGTFPTPYGILSVSHQRMDDGQVKTSYQAPKEINVLLEK